MKHVLITGGNKGIGLETTKLLLDFGYKITVIAKDIELIKGIKNCQAIKFDLQNINDISKLILDLEHIDILVNNAGIMNTCVFDNYPEDKKELMIKINLEAPIELMTCISKGMIQKKQGRIINNASIAGQIGHPDIWYGITKAGLINATKSFAKILGPHGIIVNAIAAGPVETDMMQYIPEARKEAILRSVYSGRFAQPIEIAQTILWLATASPSYINGTCIDINNGAYPR
jgi:NAD(P)-dependent dehydrogenase (short-subunit alcohol dehydrogenase family)